MIEEIQHISIIYLKASQYLTKSRAVISVVKQSDIPMLTQGV